MHHAAYRGSKGRVSKERPRGSNFIGRNISVVALGAFLFVPVFFLASCSNQTASGQHATVQMRDGSTVTGTVTASSGTEITLTGDDKATHVVPMAQVKSIEYDDAPAAQETAAQSSSTGGAFPSAGGGEPHRRSSKARADALHEEHYHPTQEEIRTKTYVLPVGTKASVRTEETIDSAKAVE